MKNEHPSPRYWTVALVLILLGGIIIWFGFNQGGIKTTVDQAYMMITIYVLSITQYYHYGFEKNA